MWHEVDAIRFLCKTHDYDFVSCKLHINQVIAGRSLVQINNTTYCIDILQWRENHTKCDCEINAAGQN